MKKYLGSYMDAYIALAFSLICFASLGGAVYVVATGYGGNTEVSVFVFLSCFAMFFFLIVYASRQMLAWGVFGSKSVKVRALFRKSFILEYSKCADVGMMCYFHSYKRTAIGSNVTYIYLSYNYVERKYKINANLMKPSNTFIKIGYSKKIYAYLIENLPERQKIMLADSYSKFIKNQGKAP